MKNDPDDSEIGYADLGHTKTDLLREQNSGFEEVVFGKGKTTSQLIDIIGHAESKSGRVFVTGVDPEMAREVIARFTGLIWDEHARTLALGQHESVSHRKLMLVSAGTSDLRVLKEAENTLKFFGFQSVRMVDVGIAGLHRLLSNLEEIRANDLLIVFAGMEGALPGVLAGLTSAPIIAVPTSVGTGVSEGGRVALDAMLSSCSPGVAVMNIDNGFGAAMFAAKLLKRFE
jgi:NCAIR mutase (PurE)-related protein